MKHLTVWVVALGLAAPASGADQDAEGLLKGLLEDVNRLVELLKTVKDKESAEKAKADLEKVYADVKKKSDQLGKLPPETERALAEKYREDFKRTGKALEREVNRVGGLRDARAVVQSLPLFRNLGDAKQKATLIHVNNLTRAVKAYKKDKDEFPRSLEALTEKTPEGYGPYITKEGLTDPWGRPFRYDPAGPRNGGTVPDIWSQGPPGRKESIGNWPKDRTKPKK